MKNPFDSKAFESAFAPCFNDRVVIEANRPDGAIRGTFAACVFQGVADPMSDGAADTSVATATVLLAKTGPLAWNRPEPPQIGDSVTLACGASFVVTRRDDLVTDHYQLEARQS